MNFLDKLDYLIERENIKRSVLSKESGVPYTTIDGFYKKGYQNAKLQTIQKIAKYFDVTLDYLIIDEIEDPDYGKTENFRVNKDEMYMVTNFRRLTDPGKSLVNKSINELLAYESELKSIPADNLINIDQYKKTVPLLGIVSAGNGIDNYFDREDVEVENDCDFALIVRGDSMEPSFYDGQIIGIQKRDTLENGEIGIIEWEHEDGSRKAYLKKWYQLNGKVKLVSLNPKYEDIIIEKGNVEVRGKVF